MQFDIFDLILNNQQNVPLDDLVGVAVKHSQFGKGHVSRYSSKHRRVSIEFDETEKTMQVDLHDLIGMKSSWKVSTKQLERKFGHLRNSSQEKPTLIGLFTWYVTTSQSKPSTPCKPVAKRQAKRRVRGGVPPGAVPLFPFAKR